MERNILHHLIQLRTCSAHGHPREMERQRPKQTAEGGRMPQILCEIIEISQVVIARNGTLNKGSSDKCIKTILRTKSPIFVWGW